MPHAVTGRAEKRLASPHQLDEAPDLTPDRGRLFAPGDGFGRPPTMLPVRSPAALQTFGRAGSSTLAAVHTAATVCHGGTATRHAGSCACPAAGRSSSCLKGLAPAGRLGFIGLIHSLPPSACLPPSLELLTAPASTAAGSIDVVDMTGADARKACAAGLLAPFDADALAPAPDGTPPAEDFIKGAIGPCSVAQLLYATVIAYDDRAFPGVKPEQVADFFNLERFPGKRALQRRPTAILEWALYSYGVPRQQIYNLLSTDRGLDLAFRRLDDIRDEIVWWRAGSEPPALLASGEVAMASGYNGRFFNAQVNWQAPITVIWDGQLLDSNVWAVPAISDNRELAHRFIRFATRPDRLAELANRISYGPTRYSAQQRIGLHRETGIAMRDHLPTTQRHLETAILQDNAWYARTADLRQRRFDTWLATDRATTD